MWQDNVAVLHAHRSMLCGLAATQLHVTFTLLALGDVWRSSRSFSFDPCASTSSSREFETPPPCAFRVIRWQTQRNGSKVSAHHCFVYRAERGKDPCFQDRETNPHRIALAGASPALCPWLCIVSWLVLASSRRIGPSTSFFFSPNNTTRTRKFGQLPLLIKHLTREPSRQFFGWFPS